MARRSQHSPPELRERAVRMVAEVTPNYDSQWAAINAVAQKLGVGTAETVRKWVRQVEEVVPVFVEVEVAVPHLSPAVR
jgi:transposase